MRILRLILEGYVGIYNGLGLDKIDINFSKCKNRICVIKGDNGSGKSTILKAINPMNESSHDYIDGMTAVKLIIYQLDDGNLLEIKYVSPSMGKGKRGTTTCAVRLMTNDKEVINLNPNSNLNEGKRIICDYLGIDNDFLLLAQLSSDDRGLADKNPSDRKKFINSKIAELEFYNGIYKKLVKKSGELRLLINSINTKIDEIGNLEQINADVKSLQTSLGELEDQRNLLIATIANQKQAYEALGEGQDIQKLYNDLLSRKETAERTIEKVSASISKSPFNSNTELTMEAISKQIISMEEKVKSEEIILSRTRADTTMLSIKIEQNKSKLANYTQFNNMAEIDAALGRCIGLNNQIAEDFNRLGFGNYDNIGKDVYDTALDTVDRINKYVYGLRDKYSDIFQYLKVTKYTNGTLLPDYTEEINELQMKLSELEVRKAQADQIGELPKACVEKNLFRKCPFGSTFGEKESSSKITAEMNRLAERLDLVLQFQKESTAANTIINKIIQFNRDTSDIWNMIPVNLLSKFKDCDWAESKDVFMEFIVSGRHIGINVQEYRNRANLITQYEANAIEIRRLLDEKELYKKNKEVIDMIQDMIDSDMTKYDELIKDVESIENMIDQYKQTIETSKTLLESRKEFDEIVEDLLKLKGEDADMGKDLENLEGKIKLANQLKLQMKADYDKLNELNIKLIPEVQDKLNESKYRIVLYKNYREEYEKYHKESEMVEKLKYYSSPTTGIQTVYMEMFMNRILNTANQLLSHFFNGEFTLQPFIINEKEFRMPCVGSGMMNDDISSMSTAQICMISMILSFALLRSTSNSYSIIKLDEIDGGLDSTNRIQFANVLNTLMNMLNYEQCIMISHNSELSMANADVILLRSNEPWDQGGNIIWSYQ